MDIPPLCLLELRFRAVAPIGGLSYFHGAKWSALFRYLLKDGLRGQSLKDADIWVQPYETGVLDYHQGDPLHLCLTFPAALLPVISDVLLKFNEAPDYGGLLAPGRSIVLDQIFCRIRRTICNPQNLATEAGILDRDILTAEIETLTALGSFHLVLPVPLRLKRPEGTKTLGHTFADEDYFLGNPVASAGVMAHFVVNIRGVASAPPQPTELTVSGGALLWMDVPYLNVGEAFTKTIGGVCGCLRLRGKPSPETAARLVIGQYTGVGKNPVFGLGFYRMPELDGVRGIAVPARGKTLLDRFITEDTLRDALRRLTDTSPGPDGITFSDMKRAGKPILTQLCRAVREGVYLPGNAKRYRLPKPAGGFREISIQNAADRLLQKTAADHLTPLIDRFLSDASFAFRAGLNRKGAAEALKAALAAGFQTGIKADIAAFFDSVDLALLGNLLAGLLPFDPLPDVILSWLTVAGGAGGLPQGSPLSPVLSNLFLQRFDRDMEQEGFRLIRYADDFVVLFPEPAREGGLDAVTASLYRLGLTLKQEKTVPVAPGKPVHFLGYCITCDEITEEDRPPDDGDGSWLPLFREAWSEGTPVYLTAVCRGAYSSGADLVVKDEKERKEAIPWNRISRLIVVGRSPFSGGVVYRAVREDIPVSFIDIMGRSIGQLHPSGHEIPNMAVFQEEKVKDAGFCLAFAREIISAKIQNSFVLLRRNGIEADAMKDMAAKAKKAEQLDALRGYEGAAARIYFAHLARLVEPFDFKGRVYHPPDGPVNVMLSFGYSLLYHRIATVLKDRGFNPRVGFFHQGRGGHLALASDLLEALRHVADRIVLSLVHLGEVKTADFVISRRAGIDLCQMEGEGFRKFIRRYEMTMAKPFTEKGGDKMSGNAYLDEMADRLKRALKLDIPYQAPRID